jgi:PAS domain S-box-containing protein
MPPGHLPVRSYLAASVFGRGGNVVGGLFLGHERAGVFSADHERMAEQIATQAGIAIERAQLLATERAARAEAEARADAAIALEAVDDGIAMIDDQGIVRLWNRAAERITGLRAGTVLGRPIGQAVAGWERIALRVPVGDRSGATTPATLPLDTVTGHERWLSLYGIAVASGTVYAFRDVTGQRELDALRSDVVATVSHELRTPIAAVYGAAQTLRGRDLDPATSERLLEVIGAESDRLAALVEEILLTSQIDSGGLTLARSEIDPRQAVAAATAGRDASSVVLDVPPDTSPACGDPEKVRQIVANLIENAFKYGRPPVTVRVREARGSVRFEVSDSGHGIPRQEQEKIFEKFYRLESHVRDGVRGTGLGLYICRELVQRMDGQIGVDSDEGRGATFWIALPRLEA